MVRSFSIAIWSFILLTTLSCSRNPVTGKREVMLLSEEQEIAMGQEADPQIVAQFGLYDDPKLQQFINEKGQQMAAVSHRKDLPYSFKIVDSPVVNAFAVPGGFVYFTRGIMAHFNNEAEFAGVLGHEIGHITARHSASQQSKAVLAQLGLVVGMVVSPEFAQFGDMASQGVGLLFYKFGRDDERESDRLGVEYSTTIGYDAKEMADFFRTLQRTSEAAGAQPIPDFLSTHPSPEERLETVGELAAEWKQKVGRPEYEIGRDSYLKMIDGIVYGEDPKQGFFEAGYFYHPELKFQFKAPEDWSKQNTPQAVQMAPKDGKALMTLTLAPDSSLEKAAQATLQKYGLQLIEKENTTVNGSPAIAMVADQPPQEGQQTQAIRTLTYLIQFEGRIYSIMGISGSADFNKYQPRFTEISTSFDRLTDQEKLSRQPERIKIRTVATNGTLEQTLKGLQTPQARLEELAILNGMMLSDPVEKGMLIKVVE